MIFLFMVVVAISYYSLLQFLDWNSDRNSAALIGLQENNVSEIKIFDNEALHEPPLATLSTPREDEIIHDFVHAINTAEPWEPQARELITSHGLYVVISLDDNDKPIELLLHFHEDCRTAVYMYLVRKPGGAKSNMTSYIGGARSAKELYDWLQSMNLSDYLGCN